MNDNRDEFTQKTKEILRSRVAGRCSKPSCRVPTTAAKSGSQVGVTNLGKAAHICAAAPGGPRFDKKMSTQQRKAADNGIWLCGNHADEIDKDVSAHPVELLKQWKLEAESKSIAEIGVKLPSDDDTVKTLAAVFTASPVNNLQSSIKNVLSASEKYYEQIDPRFSVRASFIDGKTIHEFHAKEKVTTGFKVSKAHSGKFREDYMALMDNGQELTLEHKDFKVTDSPIFKHLAKDSTPLTLTISRQPLHGDAIAKLWVTGKETKIISALDDVQGHITAGKKSFSFLGTCFRDLINLSLKQKFEDKDKLKFTLEYDFGVWDDTDVNRLPYFKKSYDFLKSVVNGGELALSLDFNGENILTGRSQENYNSLSSYYFYHRLIIFIQEISRRYSLGVVFSSDYSHTKEDFELLESYYLAITNDNKYSYDEIDGNGTLTMIISEENHDMLLEADSREPTEIKIAQSEDQDINILGKMYQLPGLSYRLTKVKLKVDSTKIKIGNKIDIILIPVDGCEYIIETI